MLNFRIITRVFSLILITEAVVMLLCAGVSFINGEHAASAFLYSALITLVTGAIVFTPLKASERISGNREGYIIVTGTWLILALFGTLPFVLSGNVSSFANAFFESMSGFTTTGATIFNDIESLPRGLILWRSLSQWMGGIGIIIVSLSIFPVVKSINIQIAATDFTGYQAEKIHPRIIDAAKRLIVIYASLTLVETILLVIGGMPPFEAVCNSFSTLSTGGFTTRNNGMAAFSSPYMMTVISVFMFLAAINPALIYFALKGKFKKATASSEFRLFAGICVVFIIMASAAIYINGHNSPGSSISNSAFHIVSFISTTGFYTQNYSTWGNVMVLLTFMLMLTGGMAGSTAGGVKLIRLLLVTRNNRQEMKRLVHPNAYLPVRLDRQLVPSGILNNVLVFITLYFLVICISTLAIAIMGYDMVTSFSTSASMLANIGPSLGSFGPFTNYSGLPTYGKYFLSVLMLLGRLELLTVIILFTRSFYRN
jgi:trk system potassium uptake protein